MKKIYLILSVILVLAIPGCGNFSPRQEQEIENEGQIGEIENLANSMKAEIGNLKSQSEIQNSKLDRIQQGLANFQSNYENSGVQVFSGPGGLVVAIVGLFSIVIMMVVVLHYRKKAVLQEKTANILAGRIVEKHDPVLENEVFQAVMYTEVEENVLNLMKKYKGG